MMLPALTATPVDSATAGAESAVDSGDGGSAFAAAIAQLGGATQASAPPTETLSLELDESATADTALVMDPVPASPLRPRAQPLRTGWRLRRRRLMQR